MILAIIIIIIIITIIIIIIIIIIISDCGFRRIHRFSLRIRHVCLVVLYKRQPLIPDVIMASPFRPGSLHFSPG